MKDMFTLRDHNGNVVARKGQVEHIKVILDELLNPEYPYVVSSEETIYELTVTRNTTVEDWRNFSEQCSRAM